MGDTVTETTNDWRAESKARRARILATLANLGLNMTCAFVPMSQSRNAGEKHRTLNWKVTIQRSGRDILTTDYSAGEGHAPSYKQGDRTIDRDAAIKGECEDGYARQSGAFRFARTNKRIEPDTCDVFHSIVSDAGVIDAGGFEQWAGDLGYDTDSRKAETIYRACLEHALKLRAAIGETGLNELREAFQDY